MADENRPAVDVRKILDRVAAEAKAIEDKHAAAAKKGKEPALELHKLAVAVSCLAPIVDAQESRIRELEVRLDNALRGRL